jgi:hypothetical protein
MSHKPTPEHARDKANSQLDDLLRKGIQADKRATKPPMPAPAQSAPPAHSAQSPILTAPRKTSAPVQTLDRLTIRFTKQEAEILEKVRAVARSMGYKISDNVVFRLALNAFKTESITPQVLENILAADGRRRQQ